MSATTTDPERPPRNRRRKRGRASSFQRSWEMYEELLKVFETKRVSG